LIVRKVTEIVATRCQVLRLKSTKIDFDWGSDPHLTGKITTHPNPPEPQLEWRRPTSNGMERVQGEGRGGEGVRKGM